MEKLQFSLFRSYECSKHAATSFDTAIRNRTLYRKARKIDRNPFLKAFLCRPRVKVTTTTDVPAKKSQKAFSFYIFTCCFSGMIRNKRNGNRLSRPRTIIFWINSPRLCLRFNLCASYTAAYFCFVILDISCDF